jgi:hypothetical protein
MQLKRAHPTTCSRFAARVHMHERLLFVGACKVVALSQCSVRKSKCCMAKLELQSGLSKPDQEHVVINESAT